MTPQGIGCITKLNAGVSRMKNPDQKEPAELTQITEQLAAAYQTLDKVNHLVFAAYHELDRLSEKLKKERSSHVL